MSKRNDIDLIRDILEAANRVLVYTKNLSYENFTKDFKTQDAVVRNLEIMGEAAKCLTEETRIKYSNIVWSDLARARDKLIHHYSGVNFDIVWDIITESLPELSSQLTKIIEKN